MILNRLRTRQPVPDTAEFYPPPPPGFGETWPIPPGSSAAAAGNGNANASVNVNGHRGPVGFYLSPESLQRMRSTGPAAAQAQAAAAPSHRPSGGQA